MRKQIEMNKTILQDALIFTLPLMMIDATSRKLTNAVTVTSERAPINQLFHAKDLVDAKFTDIVTPNVDTIYSQSFLDLTEDAVIFEFPKTDRFCMVQILDAYTNTIDVLDTTQFEKDLCRFIFTGKDFAGEIPENISQIMCPTNLVWILIRTICNDKEDMKNVYAIQNQMDSYTLAQYEAATTDQKPEGTFDENNNFVPVQHVQQMSMREYFTRANELMVSNPPKEEDADMVERMAQINVGPNLLFDSAVFGEEADIVWSKIMKNVVDYCIANSLEFMVKNGYWTYFGKPIAEFGTAYIYRALISLAGLGANPVAVAIYPKGELDAEGHRLNGANQYVLHFENGKLPPVKESGFWSVTAYNSSNDLLIDNEIDRYCINDRSEVQYNEDGSLDIYIQNERPVEDKVKNWLPVCSGDFHFILRIYLPREEAIKNEWRAPDIEKR